MTKPVQLPPPEPLGWANWRAALQGHSELVAWEFGCYTDAWVVGQVDDELGPVKLLNPVAALRDEAAAMAIIIRFSAHRPDDPPKPIRLHTHYDRYLAVDIGEEIAALVSLALGIRCRSGGLIREFRLDDDPRGRHLGYAHSAPYLRRPIALRGSQLPRIARDADGQQRRVNLSEAVPLLRRYPYASQKKAIALVRAAHIYSEAIWSCDTDPQAAWLSLVTACEIAAAERYGTNDPKNRRRKNRAPGATKRFVDFVSAYAPSPPAERPSIGALKWTDMKRHADLIYHWRSRALHDGLPFPPTMSEIPRAYADDGIPAETPLGLGVSSGTSSWRREVTPMLLHTFAYIVRGALIRWWQETPLRKSV